MPLIFWHEIHHCFLFAADSDACHTVSNCAAFSKVKFSIHDHSILSVGGFFCANTALVAGPTCGQANFIGFHPLRNEPKTNNRDADQEHECGENSAVGLRRNGSRGRCHDRGGRPRDSAGFLVFVVRLAEVVFDAGNDFVPAMASPLRVSLPRF